MGQAFFSRCPPNSERSADRILHVNAPASRDSNRSYSEAAITDAGHALVHRGQHRPPALAGVRHPAAEVLQLGRLGEGGRGQVDQPGADHRAPPPHLGDLGQVDLVLVGLGWRSGAVSASTSRWCRPTSALLMIDRPSAIAAIMPYSMPLCTILTKWPGAVRPAVQVALLGGAALAAGPAWAAHCPGPARWS